MNYPFFPFFGAFGAPYFQRCHAGASVMEIMMLANHHRCYGYGGYGGYSGYGYGGYGYGSGYGYGNPYF
jgi:hypothetical protein